MKKSTKLLGLSAAAALLISAAYPNSPSPETVTLAMKVGVFGLIGIAMPVIRTSLSLG